MASAMLNGEQPITGLSWAYHRPVIGSAYQATGINTMIHRTTIHRITNHRTTIVDTTIHCGRLIFEVIKLKRLT